MCCHALLILLAPLAVGVGAPAKDDMKKEIQRFQGAWQAVSLQYADGRQASEEEVKNTSLVVEGNKFTLTGKDFTIAGTFTIDPTKTPKAIDVVLVSKDGDKTKFLGIYELQGDARKSCFALTDKERPTQFSSEKGYFGFEWKRK
jgi:uncharacterized protein (TIGR03067 family)